MNVLVVDDDEIAVEMLRDVLEDAGHAVAHCSNGRDALKVIAEDGAHLVITDWEMPQMNGLELCKAIRGEGPDGLGLSDSGGYVYVVLLTGRDSMEERVRGLLAGADDFMAKPFNPADLLARVSCAERILSLETRDVAIFALAKLAESRDPETGAHLERVQSLSRALARSLVAQGKFTDQIDGEFIRLLHATSPLHDIGKVGIPDVVLLKPGRLSDREFEIMKEHTTLGAQTLDAAVKRFPQAKFLHMARDIALTHHERFDGTGYPLKLKGDAIPLCSRIVALADVYDALTSKRVYKDAFTHEIAKSMIVKESGTHFAPEIVEAFLAAEEAFQAIRRRFSEVSLGLAA